MASPQVSMALFCSAPQKTLLRWSTFYALGDQNRLLQQGGQG
jgi:hypothetical protein